MPHATDIPGAQPDASRSTSLFRLQKWEWAALALILLVAVGVRIYHLGYFSLWLDEIYSLATSSGHYPDIRPLEMNRLLPSTPSFTNLSDARHWRTIWPAMRQGTHPPLYLLLLRPWREMVGDSDAAVRGFSVLASLIAIGLLFDTGKRLLGSVPALWTAALMALAWPQVQFAQEARPYPLLLALGMGAMNALVRIAKDGENLRRLIALGVCLLGMALTHYFSLGALLASGVFTIIALRGKRRRRTLIAHAAAAALFLALWGPSLWNQRRIAEYRFLNDNAGHPWVATLWRVNDLPLRYFVDVYWLREISYVPGVGALVLALLAIALGRRRELLLPALWLVFTGGTIMLIDLARHTTHLAYIRYTLLAAPALYLLAAATASIKRRYVGHLLPGALLLLCALVLPSYYEQPKENWRAMGQTLAAEARPSEPLIFAASEEWSATSLPLCLSRYYHDPAQPVLALDHPASPALAAQLPPGRAWLIVAASPGQQFTPAELEAWLPGSRLVHQWDWSMAVMCKMERQPRIRQSEESRSNPK